MDKLLGRKQVPEVPEEEAFVVQSQDTAMSDLIRAATNVSIERVSSGDFLLPDDSDITQFPSAADGIDLDLFPLSDSDSDADDYATAAMTADEFVTARVAKTCAVKRVRERVERERVSRLPMRQRLLATPNTSFPVMYTNTQDWIRHEAVREGVEKTVAYVVSELEVANGRALACSGREQCAQIRRELKDVYAGFKAEKQRARYTWLKSTSHDFFTKTYVGRYYDRLHAVSKDVKDAMARVVSVTRTSPARKGAMIGGAVVQQTASLVLLAATFAVAALPR